VYRGLDIVTNKVTAEEREAVPHYLLDFLEPHEEYTVQDFRNQSLPIVSFSCISPRLKGFGVVEIIITVPVFNKAT